MFGVGQKIGGAARKAGVVTAGATLTSVGVAFLTAAAWIFLAAEHGTLIAAVVIGFTYTGLGIVIVAMGSSDGRLKAERAQQAAVSTHAETPAQMVILSFLQGMEQGRQAANTSRH